LIIEFFSSESFLDKKDFVATSSMNQKLSRTNSAHSPRRISVSTIPTKSERSVSIRLRREPKEIPKIPVLPPPTQD
jgi:hypothetical protein